MKLETLELAGTRCLAGGARGAAYLLVQMTGAPERQRLERQLRDLTVGAPPVVFAAVPVQSWNDDLSPWPAPPVQSGEGFGGGAAQTLALLNETVIPGLKTQYALDDAARIVLGGYSLAGLFALWASTQTDGLYAVAAASPSVWYPGWMEHLRHKPVRAQRVALSLGIREEHPRNAAMRPVGICIRSLYAQLAAEAEITCTLDWNPGGHFHNPERRTANVFRRALGLQPLEDRAREDG